MRGEDIQRLSIEELLKLEKMLEAGLSRVLKSKVLHPLDYFLPCINTASLCFNYITFGPLVLF